MKALIVPLDATGTLVRSCELTQQERRCLKRRRSTSLSWTSREKRHLLIVVRRVDNIDCVGRRDTDVNQREKVDTGGDINQDKTNLGEYDLEEDTLEHH